MCLLEHGFKVVKIIESHKRGERESEREREREREYKFNYMLMS